MDAQEPINAVEQISSEANLLEQATNTQTDDYVPVVNDAPKADVSTDASQEANAHLDVSSASETGRTSLESNPDKSQLPRPYEPVAKTLDSEADKDNIPISESAQTGTSEVANPIEHEKAVPDLTSALEEHLTADTAPPVNASLAASENEGALDVAPESVEDTEASVVSEAEIPTSDNEATAVEHGAATARSEPPVPEASPTEQEASMLEKPSAVEDDQGPEPAVDATATAEIEVPSTEPLIAAPASESSAPVPESVAEEYVEETSAEVTVPTPSVESEPPVAEPAAGEHAQASGEEAPIPTLVAEVAAPVPEAAVEEHVDAPSAEAIVPTPVAESAEPAPEPAAEERVEALVGEEVPADEEAPFTSSEELHEPEVETPVSGVGAEAAAPAAEVSAANVVSETAAYQDTSVVDEVTATAEGFQPEPAAEGAFAIPTEVLVAEADTIPPPEADHSEILSEEKPSVEATAEPTVSEHEVAPAKAEVDAATSAAEEVPDVEDIAIDPVHPHEEVPEIEPEVSVEEHQEVVVEEPATDEAIADAEVPAAEESSVAQQVAEQHAESLSIKSGEEIERPKSPWTPSYSVTTQGPGDVAAAENTIVPDEAEEDVPPSAAPEIVFDHVTNLETPEPTVEQPTNEAAIGSDAAPESIHAYDPPSKSPSVLALDTASLHSGEGESEERPKSPWTPSYSVTNQGTVPNDANELDQLDQLPPSVVVEGTPEAAPEALVSQSTETAEVTAHSPSVPAIDVTTSEEPEEEPAAAETVEFTPTSEEAVLSKLSVDLPTVVRPSEEERPKSPWTPSYSVTTQGPISEDPAEIEQLEQLPPPIEVPLDTEAIEQAAEVAPSVPESEVTHKEPSTVPFIDITESPATHEETRSNDVAGAGIQQDAAVTLSPTQHSSSLPPIDSTEEERPKSPWTPSYSVTRQGSVSQEAELDKLEQLPPSEVEQEIPKAPWTPSYSVTRQGSVAQEAELDRLEQLPPSANPVEAANAASLVDESEAQAKPEPASLSLSTELSLEDSKTDEPADISLVMPEVVLPDRPASPWTPSYSVTAQGPAESIKVEESETTLATKDEPFPVVAKKPSHLHLTTDTISKDGATTTAISRKRNESATSRFFPGGWFSSTPTVPDENRTRTSNDVATGEFVRSASQDSESEPVVTPVVSPGDEEKKTRWCTIM